MNAGNTDSILSVLEGYLCDNADTIGTQIASDFRHRRVEKGLTREQIAEQAGVAQSNVARFEQKGLISLKNLIMLAMALGYTSEVKGIFATPKYSTMEELTQIRQNSGKTKAYKK
ncbi:MAG: helix-turn-helix transcriptional regulator [Bacteroidales bacterium]|nr:helix-turn-helix transcriptional regulator [Bacteroidales bacterium]